MCFAAIHWARISKLFYAGTKDDAAAAGFDDSYLYEVIRGTADHESVESTPIDREKVLPLFDEWRRIEGKRTY